MNCLKEHVEYLKDNPEEYWFKRKRYGYGYGWTPAKPAGWVVLVLYLAIVLLLALKFEENILNTIENYRSFFAVIGLLTILFLLIVWRTGESPKWQWGKKAETEKESHGS